MNSHDLAVAVDPAQIVAIAQEVFSALVDDGEMLIRGRGEALFPDEPVYAWVDMTREGETAVVRTSVRMELSGTNALARALLRIDNTESVSPEDLVDAFGEVANVVGGNVGVFEGNGGDLRIGLPMQSLHDGESFRHTPLRLSVFIQAPQDPIDAIIAKHATVRHLLDNEWLTVFRLADGEGVWRYLPGGRWEPVAHE